MDQRLMRGRRRLVIIEGMMAQVRCRRFPDNAGEFVLLKHKRADGIWGTILVERLWPSQLHVELRELTGHFVEVGPESGWRVDEPALLSWNGSSSYDYFWLREDDGTEEEAEG